MEFEPPLHSFSVEEDKGLLGNCWMTNLSPRWTSSAHIPLDNSKELLLLHFLCRGYESGFWYEGVPDGLWVPLVYKQLSRSEVFDLRKRIVGELARARAFKHAPKTHKFYVEKETAHRAAQESREKHVVNVSMDQLYNLLDSVTQERESQANNGDSSGQESALTPWVAHKLRSFVHENLVRSNTGFQHKPYDYQRGQVHSTVGAKGRGSNASSNKGRGSYAPASNRGGSTASTSDLDWSEEMDREEDTAAADGDNNVPNQGGRGRGRGGFNFKRARSTSSNRTDEQVPTKRGGGVRGGQGPMARPGSSRQVTVENPSNPRDCRDKSKTWACPLWECRGHVNYNWQKQCFGCKTYFCMDRGGNWAPSTKPDGQSGGRGFSPRGTRRGSRNRG